MYIYIYAYICVKLHMGACVEMRICMYVCMYVSMYLCIYVSMYLCMYVCMYIYIYMLTPPPQLARTSSEDVSSLLQSVAGKLLFVRHQLSIFVDAAIKVLMFL